jgi:hypothetical protein
MYRKQERDSFEATEAHQRSRESEKYERDQPERQNAPFQVIAKEIAETDTLHDRSPRRLLADALGVDGIVCGMR